MYNKIRFFKLYHDTKERSKIKSDIFLMYSIKNSHFYVRMSIYVLIILLTKHIMLQVINFYLS